MLAAGGLRACSVTTPATLPAPADNLHDLPSEPCPCLERKAPSAWSGRDGHGRERPAVDYPSQALASEGLYRPTTRNPHHQQPQVDDRVAWRHGQDRSTRRVGDAEALVAG
jgi:hypothetical protein